MNHFLKNKAFLVILQTWQKSKDYLDESLSELQELSRAANIDCLGHVQARVQRPSARFFLREGKLSEIQQLAAKAKAGILLLNVDLSPAQMRNIEKFVKIPVMDRTGLILQIFGRRARTNEGKLQVELARLIYTLPRVGGLGMVMSRIGGGSRGTRGPGETELEKDTRKIRVRIQRVREELKKVMKHRQLIRSGRKKRRFISAALVGYTNTGKSTLLNALTGSNVYAENQLFATLDPTTRMQSINGRQDILFIDTVGFLRDLPHTLIDSFRATLEEVVEADLLIHVLDASQKNIHTYKQAVEVVLKELKAENKKTVLVLNKADLLSEEQKIKLMSQWPQSVLLSAKEGLGLNTLLSKIEQSIQEQEILKNELPSPTFFENGL